MSKESKATERLEQSRREVQARLEDLRKSIEREVGWAPRRMWWLPVVGFACGLALSGAVNKRRNKRARPNK